MNAPATQNANTILFPPGRLVQGSLYEGQDKDMQGAPLTVKSGANAGKPTVRYYFAVAIQKTQAQWWLEAWGSQILAIANAAWPQGQTGSPNFAWKIEDGDSQIPNQNGRKNSDREGHAGCWIVKFSSMFPAKIFDAQGNPMLQPGLVKPGFWIEVLGTVEGNGNAQKPGVYVNHNMVAFRAPDKEIQSGPDPRAVGFGRAALPAGVTAAPVGAAAFPAAAPGVPASPTPAGVPMGAPATPTGPPAANVPPATPMTAPTPAAAAPVPVSPSPSFIAPPAAGAAPGVPTAPAAPPAAALDPLGAPAGYRMANPQGGRYEAFRQNGWVDAAMIAAGHMVRL